MIPSNTIINGICSTHDNDAYTTGNPVNNMTTARINQTWLASQTGAIARDIVISSLLPAKLSTMPAPKSAPPNNAYKINEAPSIMTMSMSSYSDLAVG